MSATTAPLQNVINGELVAVAEGGMDAVVNPATGEEIAQVASSTQVGVDRAVAAARDAVEDYTQIKRVMASLSCDACPDRWEERHTSAAGDPPRGGRRVAPDYAANYGTSARVSGYSRLGAPCGSRQHPCTRRAAPGFGPAPAAAVR